MAFSDEFFQNLWLYVLPGIFLGILEILRGVEKTFNFGSEWLPGLLYGAFFGIANLPTSQLALSYAILSAAIYFFAVYLGAKIVRFKKDSWSFNRHSLISAGLISGFLGALALAMILKLFTGVKFDFKAEIVTAITGAITGPIFLLLPDIIDNKKQSPLYDLFKTSSTFIVWQVPVGLSLQLSIYNKPLDQSLGSFANSLNMFLQGPTVQLIGLIASFFGIISFFNQKRK